MHYFKNKCKWFFKVSKREKIRPYTFIPFFDCLETLKQNALVFYKASQHASLIKKNGGILKFFTSCRQLSWCLCFKYLNTFYWYSVKEMSELEFDALSNSRFWCCIKLMMILILHKTHGWHLIPLFHWGFKPETICIFLWDDYPMNK